MIYTFETVNGEYTPVTLEDYATWEKENPNIRVIARTTLVDDKVKEEVKPADPAVATDATAPAESKNEVLVCTSFLMIDHNMININKFREPEPVLEVGWRDIDADFVASADQIGEEVVPEDTVPILWETLIFAGPYNDMKWRYRTLQDAKEGHDKIIEALQHQQPLPGRYVDGANEYAMVGQGSRK